MTQSEAEHQVFLAAIDEIENDLIDCGTMFGDGHMLGKTTMKTRKTASEITVEAALLWIVSQS